MVPALWRKEVIMIMKRTRKDQFTERELELIQCAIDEHGAAVRDNSLEELLAIGKNLEGEDHD